MFLCNICNRDDPTVSENIEIYEEQLPWWPSVIRVLPLVHTALTENFPSFQRIQFYEYLWQLFNFREITIGQINAACQQQNHFNKIF